MSSLLLETYNPKNGTVVNTRNFDVNELFEHYIYLANRCIITIFNNIDLKRRRDIDAEDIKNDAYMKLLEICYKCFDNKNRSSNIKGNMESWVESYINKFNPKVEYTEKVDHDEYYYIDDKLIFEQFNEAMRERIDSILSTLTPREERVIQYHFFEEMNFTDIGKIFGVYGERIRQIESRALKKLRHRSRSKQLKEYFEFL